jgi:hypothetical protein
VTQAGIQVLHGNGTPEGNVEYRASQVGIQVLYEAGIVTSVEQFQVVLVG